MNTPISELSLAEFQTMNRQIYGATNSINYEKSDMVTRLHRYVTLILKAVRKNETEGVAFNLTMAFSWSTALANALHIELQAEVWNRFPGVCCYCGCIPCTCHKRGQSRITYCPTSREQVSNLRDYQLCFVQIYPNNTLLDSAAHLAEEVDELDEALTQFRGTHDKNIFENIKIELVDVIANIFAVANVLRIDLGHEMEISFLDGCPKCNTFNCECGFVTADTTLLRA